MELAISFVSRFENEINPKQDRREAISDFFNHASVYVSSEQLKQVEALAKQIMAMGIKWKDAMHLACANISGCELFVTTDGKIIKNYKSKGLIACSPVAFFDFYGGKEDA